MIRNHNGRIVPPGPEPDGFDLAYFAHCMAYLEQCREDSRRRWQAIGRVLRGGTIALLLLSLAFAPLPVPPLPVGGIVPHVLPVKGR